MTINFKDLNIKPREKSFGGDKIRIEKILNRQITVNDYKIVPSTKNQGEDCLHLSFNMNENQYILFSGSTYLMDMIRQVPRDKMPFITTIVKANDSLIFT